MSLFPSPFKFDFANPFKIEFTWANPKDWGDKLWEAFETAVKKILEALDQYVFKPIIGAIHDFFEWAWKQIQDIFNTIVQAIMNFIYSWVINPILSFFQMILNKVVAKLKGVIYITIVTPLLISEAKDFLHEPTLEKGAKMLMKPFLGYFITEIIYNVLYPQTRPVTIRPQLPPIMPKLPGLKELSTFKSDLVSVSDTITTEFIQCQALTMSDAINVLDAEVSNIIEWTKTNISDEVNVSDTVIVETITEGEISVSDSISVSDEEHIWFADYVGFLTIYGTIT